MSLDSLLSWRNLRVLGLGAFLSLAGAGCGYFTASAHRYTGSTPQGCTGENDVVCNVEADLMALKGENRIFFAGSRYVFKNDQCIVEKVMDDDPLNRVLNYLNRKKTDYAKATNKTDAQVSDLIKKLQDIYNLRANQIIIPTSYVCWVKEQLVKLKQDNAVDERNKGLYLDARNLLRKAKARYANRAEVERLYEVVAGATDLLHEDAIKAVLPAIKQNVADIVRLA